MYGGKSVPVALRRLKSSYFSFFFACFYSYFDELYVFEKGMSLTFRFFVRLKSSSSWALHLVGTSGQICWSKQKITLN